MRVIDNSRRLQPFFMEVGFGETFRRGGKVFVKIADVFLDKDISDFLDDYYAINHIEELRDNISVLNAYCLDDCFLTYFEDDDFVELIDCEIHIV